MDINLKEMKVKSFHLAAVSIFGFRSKKERTLL